MLSSFFSLIFAVFSDFQENFEKIKLVNNIMDSFQWSILSSNSKFIKMFSSKTKNTIIHSI